MTDVATPTAIDTHSAAAAPAPSQRRLSRRKSASALVLLALMAFSVFAHVAAIHRALPLQDGDEEFFVRPAVAIAASGDLNPHWFGHPGSTVIYPVAALIHVWDATLHDGSLLTSNPRLEERFAKNPEPFYLIARVWTIALSVASIPALFALGHRAFNRRVGLIAAALWAVIPTVIHYGRIARTESAATFFGVVALYFCVRAWQEPRRRWWVLAGLSIGLAVSSRYFMAALLPCLLAAAALPLRGERRRAVVAAVTAIIAAGVGFVLTTPYWLLDLSTAVGDLRDEATVSHTVAIGLSPAGNARWYVEAAIPAALSWPLYIAALLGIAAIVRRRRAHQLMLVAFCGIFLAAISVSVLHWARWTIQILPLLVLFAAVAIHKATRVLAARAPSALHLAVVAPVVLVLALAIGPVEQIVKMNRYDAAAPTSQQAREWMQHNIPPGSHVSQLHATFNVPVWSIARIGHGIKIDYDLDPTKLLSDYRKAGVDYVATGAGDPYKYIFTSRQFPKQAAFYLELACKTRLVAQFPGGMSRDGWPISIYRLDEAPLRILNVVCLQAVPART